MLALLAFISAFTGGMLYYSSFKQSILQIAELESRLNVTNNKEQFSFLLTEKLNSVKALSGIKELKHALETPNPENIETANDILVHFNETLASDVCYLMDRAGNTISSSNFSASDSFVGKNYSFRPYFQNAIGGQSAIYLALGVTSKKRGVYYGHPLFGKDSKDPIGVLVLKAPVEFMEKSLQSHGYIREAIVMVVAPNGIIFMSNQHAWLYQSMTRLDDETTARIAGSRQFGTGPWNWTGLVLDTDNRIIDRAGKAFLYHRTDIDDLPGWSLINLISIDQISKDAINPFILPSGYIVAAVFFFVGISVVVLYRMASSELGKRKAVEGVLRTSENRYRVLTEESPQGISLIGADGVYKYINPKFQEIFGYSLNDFSTGAEWFTLAFPDREHRLKIISAWNSDQEDHGLGECRPRTYDVRCKDGSVKTIFFRSVALENGDQIVTYEDITVQNRIAEALKESEEKFRLISEQSLLGISIIQDGVYKYVNQATALFTGYSIEEMMGWKAEEFTRLIHPDDLNFVMDQFKKKQAGEQDAVVNYIYRGISKSGDVKWIEQYSKSVLYNGRTADLVTVNDVTDRKKAEDSLRASEEQFQQIASNIRSVLWIWSADWSILYFVSSAFEVIWQVNRESLHQKPHLWLESIVADERHKVVTFVSNISNDDGKPLLFPEYRIQRTDGSIRWITSRAFPVFNDRKEVIRWVGIAEDMTDHKYSQELIIQYEKMMSVGGLAAGMAHELNNPLGGILQGIQNIKRRLSPDLAANQEVAEKCGVNLQDLQDYMEKRDIDTYIQGVRDSGERAAKIISDMLSFSRKSESQMVPANLNQLLEYALKLAESDFDLKKKYDFKDLQIIKEFDPDLPEVPCIESEITQVILNLLRNSAQALAEMEHLEVPRIILRTSADGDTVKIEIEDNGPGIPESTKMRIFEPFFTTKPVGQGTGLGLAVSYMIITKNHSGVLAVESDGNRGTTFIIQLPV